MEISFLIVGKPKKKLQTLLLKQNVNKMLKAQSD